MKFFSRPVRCVAFFPSKIYLSHLKYFEGSVEFSSLVLWGLNSECKLLVSHLKFARFIGPGGMQ